MYTHTYKHVHTSNAHSITGCNWQRSRSWQPIETWRDSAIVVTLVYWCLSIHLRAHVSVFRQMKREMEVWPRRLSGLISLCNLFYTSALVLTVFPTLSLPFPTLSPLIPASLCLFPWTPFLLHHVIDTHFKVEWQLSCTWLRCAGKCSSWRSLIHNAEALALFWEREQISWRNPSQLERC